MKYIFTLAWFIFAIPFNTFSQTIEIDADAILEKIDENMSSENRSVVSDMVIQGRRRSRIISSKTYAEGDDRTLTEYLAPAREKGTKMLKLKDRLWIYSPSSDRTIQISGHMLKQSVMGSDLSYEDMMEDRKLTEIYQAKVIREEELEARSCWVVEMIAIVDDVAYQKRMVWVDQERYIPLKEELFAKSGQLLKKTTLSNVQKVDNRWFPMKINYKDMLKDGNGTDYIIKEIQFDVNIPPHIFSKAALSK